MILGYIDIKIIIITSSAQFRISFYSLLASLLHTFISQNRREHGTSNGEKLARMMMMMTIRRFSMDGKWMKRIHTYIHSIAF